MAKKARRKEKKYKLRFRPTPISRLRHYRYPIRMVGDPVYNGSSWESRAKAVYEYEMDKKANDPRGFTNAQYYAAMALNELIDYHVSRKWQEHDGAWEENILFDLEQAERDNAAWGLSP